MSELRKLIEESFELFLKKRWLKVIEKEIKKYNKSKDKANRYANKVKMSEKVIKDLVEKYNKTFCKEGDEDATQ